MLLARLWLPLALCYAPRSQYPRDCGRAFLRPFLADETPSTAEVMSMMSDMVEFSNGSCLKENSVIELARHISLRRAAEIIGVSYLELQDKADGLFALGGQKSGDPLSKGELQEENDYLRKKIRAAQRALNGGGGDDE